MPLEPVARQSLPDAVFDQLVAGIVAGDFAVGSTLPSERRLAEALGVSRPAVREALQRLAQSGLVATRQGDGTTVRDWQQAGGPDLLPRLLVNAAGEVDLRVARSIIEARSAIGPAVARLAAERGPDGLDARLDVILDELGATDDTIALQRAAIRFWDTLVDASDNVAFRLMFNTLTAAYTPVMDALAVVMAPEVSDTSAYRRVAEAVLARASARAETAARALLDPGTARLTAAIDDLLTTDDTEDDHA